MKIFLYSSSVYSSHLFLISSVSIRSIQFLSFIVPIFAWNIPLVSLIFLNRSLDFPILLFSSMSLQGSLRKAFKSLLAIVWISAFKCVYYSFSPLLFTSLLFTAICKASSDSHFAFLFFLFSFIFISWRLITSQHFSGFCHTLTWISHGVTCIPHPDRPSHLRSWSLSPVQYHKPPSIVIQALCLSDLILWIYLSLPLYNHKGFDLGHTWMS